MIRSSEKTSGLKRSLTSRHLSMIAIGGSIGTGLFVASGSAISQAGPAGALLCFAIIGVMVYFLMTSLGELAAYMPVAGSFTTYADHFLDKSIGFALGWNYWYSWSITIAVDLVAAQLVMQYWFPDVSGWIWSALFLGIIFSLNILSVKAFGEAEYWFSLIKVLTIIVFIATGFATIFGILEGKQPTGWANWATGEGPFAGGFMSFVGVTLAVGFSFQGTELIGITAGESENPGKNIPKAIKQVFWRILLFYILSIFVISLIIPYTDSRLLRTGVTDIAVSPFTLVFERAGLLSAAAIMNAVILTAVLSAGNSGMYAAARMLFTMAREGKAPKCFARLSKRGIPRNALIATVAVAALCFLSSLFGNQTVYLCLLNASGMCGFIAWLGIAACHYRFRKGFVMKGNDIKKLPYHSAFFPVGPLFAFSLCLVITLGQNYQAWLTETIDWHSVATTYIGIPIFMSLWLGYKVVNKTKYVQYEDMQFPELYRKKVAAKIHLSAPSINRKQVQKPQWLRRPSAMSINQSKLRHGSALRLYTTRGYVPTRYAHARSPI